MNVLSIDFDIIMAPDIGLYNPMVKAGQNEDNITVEKLAKDFPMLQYCRADLNHYHKIISYLLTQISNLKFEDIRVSFNHEDIKNVLGDCDNVNMFSIDHHHDLGYPNPEKDEEEETKCHCANWGDYFLSNKTINSFTWLKNANSEEHPIYKNDLRVKMINLADFDLKQLPKMDKLFICLSPEWVAPMYYPLFYAMLDLINQQKDCHLEVY